MRPSSPSTSQPRPGDAAAAVEPTQPSVAAAQDDAPVAHPQPEEADTAQRERQASRMTVLGSCVTAEADHEKSVQERVRRAWHSWSQVRAQCVNKRIPLRARARLLDAVVLPTLMWGLEARSLTRAQRRLLNTLQRAMVQNAMRLPRRSDEGQEAYCTRRERITTARIWDSMPSPWGWAVHVLRACSAHGRLASGLCHAEVERVAVADLHSGLLAAKTGGQAGRRPAGQGVPKHSERAIQDSLVEAQRMRVPVVQPWWQPPREADELRRQAHPPRRGPAEGDAHKPHATQLHRERASVTRGTMPR